MPPRRLCPRKAASGKSEIGDARDGQSTATAAHSATPPISLALVLNHIYPGNAVSWRFVAPAKASSLGILIPEATPDHVKIIVHNLDAVPVKTQMTGWEIDPGQWEITQGIQVSPEGDGSTVKKWTAEPRRKSPRWQSR